MLNDNQIREAINNNQIEIYYFFYKDKNGKIVEYKKETSYIEAKEFEKYLYSDRLKVTLGPLVKTLNHKKVHNKYRFKDYSDCFDLRKSGNKYILKPGESIIILTNERIVLDGKHSVLIIPRVSLSEVGIIITSAYIDPYYNGLLRLNVTNNSQSSYELKILETIAQCFFFQLPNAVDSSYEKQFSQKSVFLGQNWESIFSEDRPPFPVKKSKKRTNPVIDKIKDNFQIAFNFINKNALLTAIVSAFIIGYAGYTSFNNYKVNTEKILSNYENISTEIVVNSGDTYGERRITVECEKDEIITILCNHDNIGFEIFSGKKEGTSDIVFSYKIEEVQQNDFEIDFSYVVVKRV